MARTPTEITVKVADLLPVKTALTQASRRINAFMDVARQAIPYLDSSPGRADSETPNVLALELRLLIRECCDGPAGGSGRYGFFGEHALDCPVLADWQKIMAWRRNPNDIDATGASAGSD